MNEAQLWVLSERCPDHKELTKEEHQPQLQENCVTEEIKESVFEDDSDDEPLVSDSEEEDTEQKRNIRLNKQLALEELKKKKTSIFNNRKPKKWNVRFQKN